MACPKMRLLGEAPAFAQLTCEQRKVLADKLRPRKYSKDNIIFSQGETGNDMHIIDSGMVHIYTTSMDKSLSIVVLSRGAFFGELALLGDDNAPYLLRSASAQALEETNTWALSRADFRDILKNRPEVIAAFLIEELANRVRHANWQASVLSSEDATPRVGFLLLALAGQHSDLREGAITVTLSLSRELLAQTIGIERETFSRALKRLRDEELIAYDRKQSKVITILDCDKLRIWLKADFG